MVIIGFPEIAEVVLYSHLSFLRIILFLILELGLSFGVGKGCLIH